ncbi:MAG: 50S ribosomal protein L19 [Puniceicoccales bacterium]|jgi:large subunit ribosomal protein L19|nr:50S ribosomal protein L19 [Puniceicoccales bacterium]
MSQQIINSVSASQLKSGRDNFKVGDGVKVYTKVREGDKERVQVFAGIVIARKGGGISETFTVRRISYGEGVERVFPVHSPLIEKVVVDRESVPMKARLYYLRDRLGKKATKVKEKRFFEAAVIEVAPVAAAVPAVAE